MGSTTLFRFGDEIRKDAIGNTPPTIPALYSASHHPNIGLVLKTLLLVDRWSFR